MRLFGILFAKAHKTGSFKHTPCACSAIQAARPRLRYEGARQCRSFSTRHHADPVKVLQLIAAFQTSGHSVANLDPLGLGQADLDASLPPDLDIASYFSKSEMGLEVKFEKGGTQGGFASVEGMTVGDLVERLRSTYASTIGIEFAHLDRKVERDWIRDRLETPAPPVVGHSERVAWLEMLCRATLLESFLGQHFSSIKRFGLEGCESLVVGLDEMLQHASKHGVEHIVMGMPHRGRINVLANVLRKPLEQIMCEFKGSGVGTPADMAHLRERSDAAFERFDKDGSGSLDLAELQAALHIVGIEASDDEVMMTLEEFDDDGSYTLDRTEFHALAVRLLSRSFSGDEKYHLGTSITRQGPGGAELSVSLLPNPSHLEAVNPLVMGMARAKQHAMDDGERSRCMPVLLHGDAAFAGQGVVVETLGLSDLHAYSAGGCVHLVVNNQIGFTTDPMTSRSTPYCTDVAKAIRAPILHVNGDDVEAVVRVCRLAVEFRQAFRHDVVVDIVCYRRNGHQEIDNPLFTQPGMYRVIKEQVPVLEQFAAQLEASGVLAAGAMQALRERVLAEYAAKLEASRQWKPDKSEWMLSVRPAAVSSLMRGEVLTSTGVSEEVLREVGRAVTSLPKSVQAHRVVAALYKQRAKMIEAGDGIDWALAEQLAWGTLVREGRHVRVSGQDVERGTFSHRHAVIHDQVELGNTYVPLAHLAARAPPLSAPKDGAQEDSARSVSLTRSGEGSGGGFTISNSPLSEYAVLGFELGYSLDASAGDALVVWEAQFGDFANTAQCIIDQFVVACESKWQQQTGLVMLLPHGLEGGGPEHSSARLERFLQLCDDDARRLPEDSFPNLRAGGSSDLEKQLQSQAANLQVVNVTTPANYFHVLRRQVAQPFRKPLVVMAPKGLLRHRSVVSPLKDLATGSSFEPVLAARTPPKRARKLILCSGRVAIDLVDACHERQRASEPAASEGSGASGTSSPAALEYADDIAVFKIEQLSPFPYARVREVLQQHAGARLVWCQEEAANNGAWTYVRPRLELLLQHMKDHQQEEQGHHSVRRLEYCGRAPSAAPATGLSSVHVSEKKAFLAEALS